MTLRDSKTQAPVVIRMGVVSGTLDGFLAREIVKYTRENKRIRFHLTESSSENLMDLVRQEKLDMAIVDSTDRDRSLHFRKLYERDYFVALPSAHPFADRASINPRDVVQEPQVVFNYNVGKSFKEYLVSPLSKLKSLGPIPMENSSTRILFAFASKKCPISCTNIIVPNTKIARTIPNLPPTLYLLIYFFLCL